MWILWNILGGLILILGAGLFIWYVVYPIVLLLR
jgi:hypothetical protein